MNNKTVQLHLVAQGGRAMDRFAIHTLQGRGHKVKIGCHNSRVELLLNKYPNEFVTISNALYSIKTKKVDVDGSINYIDFDGNVVEMCNLNDEKVNRLIRKIFKRDE